MEERAVIQQQLLKKIHHAPKGMSRTLRIGLVLRLRPKDVAEVGADSKEEKTRAMREEIKQRREARE